MSDEPMELFKGTVDVLILKTLSREPRHGYGVSRWIRERTGDAFTLEEGALYPALRRLERKGWVSAEWGVSDTGRDAKFYELTPEGERRLEREIQRWGRYVEAMGRVLYAREADA